MAFFKQATDAEKTQKRMQKELVRVAKQQRAFAAKERKAQKARVKLASKEAKRQEKHAQQQQKKAQKSRQKAVSVAKKATKTRIRLARKAEKQRARAHKRKQRRAQRDAAAVAAGAPPFTKSADCNVCGKKFGQALYRRRHHCRQCRESCCLQCTSRTRRPVPHFGLQKPQKVCVVCETLVFNNEPVGAATSQPREPAEAVAALAASARRPHSAPLPPTEGVTVALPATTRGRGRGRSTRSKGGSIWKLPIRPLLKRKKSAGQLRNRKLDLDLQLEKRLLFGGRAIELQPQAARAP